jgi:hypothetical protein
MVNRVLFYFAGLLPSATVINYKSTSCWVFLGKGIGPVYGYPPGVPQDPDHPLSSGPCPGECCEYIYETFHQGSEIGIHLVHKSIPEDIVCLTQEEEPLLPQDCEVICDPFGYVEKGSLASPDNIVTVVSYPNPVNSNITLDISNLIEDNYQINVYDNSSRLMNKFDIHVKNSLNFNCNVKDLQNGIYFFNIIKGENHYKTVKFFVKK